MSQVRLALRAPLIALIMLALTTSAADAHSGPVAATPAGIDERELQRFETALLGATHAAEHSRQRREARRTPRRPARVRPRARLAAAGPASEVGAWESGPQAILARGAHRGIFGIHAALLPTGKVMWFSYPGGAIATDPRGEGVAVLWDPATGRFEDVPPPTDSTTGRPLNIWCAGQSFLRDGRLLVTGGNLQYRDDAQPGSDYAGLKLTLTFDPWEWERSRDPDRAWRRHEDMARGRWYPSQLLMPDGRTVILQGRDEYGAGAENPDIEVFDPSRPLNDEVVKVGTVPEQYMGANYPHTFWMPSGRALVAGPERPNSWFLEGSGLSLVDTDSPTVNRTWGTAVLMPLDANSRTGEVMQIAGSPDGAGSTATVERFDEADAAAPGNAWRTPAETLSVARSHHNTVLLPDGSMVTLGGGVGNRPGAGGQFAAEEAHKQVELYDPAKGAWRLGPAQRENRAYHSTAVLLPDGSVVSAGDDDNGGGNSDTYEIYKPPYFFRGDRPRLESAPSRAQYGSKLRVASPDDDVTSAVLVAPAATTHAVDMNQRLVRLPVNRTDGGYDVGTPGNANVAVPGFHMLFLIDRNGLPSSAKWIEIGRDPEPEPVPAPAPEPAPAADPAPAPAATTPTPAPAPAAPARPGAAAGTGTAPAGAGPPGLRADPGSPRVRLTVRGLRRLTLARRGRLTLRVTVSEAARVKLSLRVGNQRLTAAGRSRTLRFRRQGARTVTLRLDRATRSRLRRSRKVRVELRTTARDAAGNRRDQRLVRALP